MDYPKAYQILFNGITQALVELGKTKFAQPEVMKAKIILQRSQQHTEAMYMQSDEAGFVTRRL